MFLHNSLCIMVETYFWCQNQTGSILSQCVVNLYKKDFYFYFLLYLFLSLFFHAVSTACRKTYNNLFKKKKEFLHICMIIENTYQYTYTANCKQTFCEQFKFNMYSTGATKIVTFLFKI